MSAVARLTIEGVDERIHGFREVLDRTTARLADLDADVTRRLLESSQEIRGATAAAQADAAQRHDALWQGQLALERALGKITHERGPRRSAPQWVLTRLSALLDGPSVELPLSGASEPLRLTEASGPTVSCTIAETFERMSADFDVVTAFLTAVARAWGEDTERLHLVAARVARLEAELEGSGVRRPNDLALVTVDVESAATTAREDPLALDPDAITLLEARAQRVGAMTDEANRDRRVDKEKLLEAERSIEAGLETLGACRLQLDLLSERIVIPASTVEKLDTAARDLQRLGLDCARAQSLGAGSSAEELRRRSAHLHEEVRQVAAAESTRMERRNELRGLLGAYRAKASAVGLAENNEIDALWRAAHDELYEAPSDVEEAQRRVTALQRAIVRLQGESRHDVV